MADISVGIGGNNAGLLKALAESKAAVLESTEGMRGAFEKVAGAFELVNKAMFTLTAVLAGGKLFGEAVSAAVQAGQGARELGRQFGITATQASVLRVAMDDQLVSTESVSAAGNKIAQVLVKNEEAFTRLGVATRDQNGHYRNSLDIMLDVNSRLSAMREGTDRNVEGMAIYGKAWPTVSDSIRVNSEAMKDAEASAKELNLEVGERGAANVLTYQKAMHEAHDVFEGVMKTIGDALLPVLTQMAQWFREIGPQAIEVTKAAINGVVIVFEAIKVTLQTVYEHLLWFGQELVAVVKMTANSLERVMHLDFAGAKAAWAKGLDEMKAISDTRLAKIKADWAAAASAIGGVNAPDKPQDKLPGGEQSDHESNTKTAGQMAAWESEFAQFRANLAEASNTSGQFLELTKQDELAYWQAILDKQKDGSAEQIALKRKVADMTYAIRKQDFSAELSDLRTREAAAKGHFDEQIALEQQVSDRLRAAHMEDSSEYAASQRRLVELRQQAADQQNKIDNMRAQTVRNSALMEVDAEAEAARQKFDIGATSNEQYIAQEQQFEARKYAIKRQAMLEELQLEAQTTNDPQKQAQINAQLEALEQQHQQALGKIQQQAAAQSQQNWKQLYSGMQSGFASAFTGMLNGTQSLAQGIKNLFKAVLDSVIGVLANIAAQWLASAIMQRIIGKTTAVSQIAANAGIAATAAMASVAAIPFYGWAMAPGVGASTFATAMSYQASTAAAQGFDVPAGVNPVTQLHQKEMVLPATLADTVRDMAGQRGPGAQMTSGAPVEVKISGPRMGNFFLVHQDELATAIKSIVRSGQRLPV